MSVIEQALARATRARQNAGSRGTLVTFGTVGIQTVLGASRYQHGIRGGSEKLKNFAQLVEDAWGDSVVYAGGGQGLLLLPAAVSVEAESGRLRRLYEDHVPLGQLAIGQVPWSAATEAQALKLLEWAGRIAKEEATPRSPSLPPPKCKPAELCQNCHATLADGRAFRTHERAKEIPACVACSELMYFGLEVVVDGKDRSPDLVRLSPPGNNRLATLAADGNKLGRMFARLETLRERAIASAIVAAVFDEALKSAERVAGSWWDAQEGGRHQPRTLTLISGGDDLRVWLDPSALVTFVDELTARLHKGFDHHARQLPAEYSELAAHLQRVGIGIGAVVGPDTYPALRFGEVAKRGELRAKAGCNEQNWRSGIEVTFLTTGEEDPEEKQHLPLKLGDAQTGWRQAVLRAQALRSVPASQRSALFALRGRVNADNSAPPPEELENFFRYQVARGKEWRLYLQECGVNLNNVTAAEVGSALPLPWHEDLAECLVQKEGRHEVIRR